MSGDRLTEAKRQMAELDEDTYADFIKYDVSWLIAEVERLRVALDKLRELAQHSIDDRSMQPLVFSDTIIEIIDATAAERAYLERLTEGDEK